MDSNTDGSFTVADFNYWDPRESRKQILGTSRKHAYIILTPLNPTFI